MNNEILKILKRLETKIDDNATDIKEMKADIKSFKDQFTDFEGKNANNHVEVINRLDSVKRPKYNGISNV